MRIRHLTGRSFYQKGCPSQFVLELFWRDLQRDEAIRSCGEVNGVIEWPFSKALPAVDLEHVPETLIDVEGAPKSADS